MYMTTDNKMDFIGLQNNILIEWWLTHKKNT
jgi:hypothetical protein